MKALIALMLVLAISAPASDSVRGGFDLQLTETPTDIGILLVTYFDGVEKDFRPNLVVLRQSLGMLETFETYLKKVEAEYASLRVKILNKIVRGPGEVVYETEGEYTPGLRVRCYTRVLLGVHAVKRLFATTDEPCVYTVSGTSLPSQWEAYKKGMVETVDGFEIDRTVETTEAEPMK